MEVKTVAALGLGAALGAGVCYLYLRSSHGTSLIKSTSTSLLSSGCRHSFLTESHARHG